MSQMADSPFSPLLDELHRTIAVEDREGFSLLWPATGRDYARRLFAGILDLKSATKAIESVTKPIASGCGIIRLSNGRDRSIDLGYCRLGDKPQLVWKYAIARKKAIADWRVLPTGRYNVYLSPNSIENGPFEILDYSTERIMDYFSSRPLTEKADFILLSRRDELKGAVPHLLNQCDYLDSITGEIISSSLDNFHEITHRVLLLNGFPSGAVTLLQEGSADIFNPRPFEKEKDISLSPELIRKLLHEDFFYSDMKNFSYSAKFCNGIIQLLGLKCLRELFYASKDSFTQELERKSGCSLEAFVERVMTETRLPPKICLAKS